MSDFSFFFLSFCFCFVCFVAQVDQQVSLSSQLRDSALDVMQDPENLYPQNFSLASCDVKELASQMTILDSMFFKAIRVSSHFILLSGDPLFVLYSSFIFAC